MKKEKIGYKKGLIKELSWSFLWITVVSLMVAFYVKAFSYGEKILSWNLAIGYGYSTFLILSIFMTVVSLIVAGNEHYNNFDDEDGGGL